MSAKRNKNTLPCHQETAFSMEIYHWPNLCKQRPRLPEDAGIELHFHTIGVFSEWTLSNLSGVNDRYIFCWMKTVYIRNCTFALLPSDSRTASAWHIVVRLSTGTAIRCFLPTVENMETDSFFSSLCIVQIHTPGGEKRNYGKYSPRVKIFPLWERLNAITKD